MNAMFAPKPITQPVHRTPIITHKPVLKILGLGGGGSNAINRLVELGLQDVEFIAANTDQQALRQCLAPVKIQLGPRVTRGLGAGGDPKTGEAAAEESHRELAAALSGADMVFLTAGMGGGTGTGSIPVAARVARELGAVTVAVVTTPFSFELGKRQRNAREGLAQLQPHTDTLITVPNDRLLKIAPPNLTLDLAFQVADDVLRQGIQGVAELITQPGLINVDFAHIRQVMKMGGGALMSIGIGEGENKALKAVEQALHHPLLDSISIDSATGIIANFTGGDTLSFVEVMEALNHLQLKTGSQAEIIPGVINDPRMEDRAQAILVITGLGATAIEAALPGAKPAAAQKPQSRPAQTPDRYEGARVETRPAAPAEGAPLPTTRLLTMTMPFQMSQNSPQQEQVPDSFEAMEVSAVAPVDYDLPAFMRRRSR